MGLRGSQRDWKRGVRIVGVALLLVLAGCTSVSVDTRVGGDGTVKNYQVEGQMTQETFEQYQTAASAEGYDSVCAGIRDNYNESRYNSFNCNTQTSNGNATVTFTLKGWDPSFESRVTVRETDEGNISYEDTLDNRYDLSGATAEYTLRMPGKVYGTNGVIADNGRRVTWTKESGERQPGRVYARSAPSSSLIPGLRLISPRYVFAVLSLLGAAGYVFALRSEDVTVFDLPDNVHK